MTSATTPETSAAPSSLTRPEVSLRLPAEVAYASVLRMTTAGLGARVDFTLDDIEDLRTAVGEACTMVLENAATAAPDGLQVDYHLGEPGRVSVTVSAATTAPNAPDEDSWAWQVLAALTSSVHADISGDRLTITLTVTSEVADLDG